MIDKKDIQELTRRTVACLLGKQDEMQNATFKIGEANIDKQISDIACRCCKEAWEQLQQDVPEYQNVTLTISGPDILLSFKLPNGMIKKYKIELKTCKEDYLKLGSTIRTLNVNQYLIYIWKTEPKFQVRYSTYNNAMTIGEFDTFNDRTPRPPLKFCNMNTHDEIVDVPPNVIKEDWIPHYANSAMARINELLKPKNERKNRLIRETWQERLVNIIINIFIRNTSVEKFQELKNEQLTAH